MQNFLFEAPLKKERLGEHVKEGPFELKWGRDRGGETWKSGLRAQFRAQGV